MSSCYRLPNFQFLSIGEGNKSTSAVVLIKGRLRVDEEFDSTMVDFVARLFDTDFMPHVYCLRLAQVVWLHVVSDGLIAIAYAAIPLGLVRLLRKRRDLSFSWMFILFATFIFSCGATHLLSILTLWVPIYRFEGLVKLVTACSSIATAVLLFRVIPQIADIPSLTQWRRSNEELQTEIGERKRAEAKFRNLLETVPDAVVVVDREGKIVLVNRKVEKLFGYARQEVIGHGIEMLVQDGLWGKGPAPGAGFFGEPGAASRESGVELRGFRKDGTEFPLDMSLGSLETEDGLLISSTIRDLTERNRGQQAREQLAQSEAANRAKSTFLSTMSHEIRTPMNAILGYAQLMLRDPQMGTEAKQNLKTIGRSGEHLLALINDVLDMSKIEAGRIDLSPVTFNLAGLVTDLAAMFRLRAQEKDLALEASCDGEAAPYVVADESKIRQVLINLLANAVKFTHRGHIKLRVSLEQRRGDQLWLSALVEDTGVGLTEEEQGKLFEPFTQISTGVHRQEGTGLGLAISRSYARLMGGDITLTSNPGHGSIFRFEIPIRRGDSQIAAKHAVTRRVRGLRAGTIVPSILVVDDQPENRDWLMKLLNSIGFSTRGAHNGEVAIQRWREWNPQLILMDVHMPVMNGLEATRRIKADPRGRDVVIITLTASVLIENREAVSQSGSDAFIPKPCREDELLEKIRTLLNLTYEYEEISDPEGQAAGALEPLSGEKLGALPHELIVELQKATLSGDKKSLDRLILQVGKTEGPAIGNSLQTIADRYQYDALAVLLEEASRR